MPQIRLVNHAFNCEIIYYLNDADPAKIDNRMLKQNPSIRCEDPAALLAGLVSMAHLAPKDILDAEGKVTQHWDYHGEIPATDLKGSLKDFLDRIAKALPKDYVFHHAGVNVALREVEKFDLKTRRSYKTGKYGNIELKFRPKSAVVVAGMNPDRMIVINLHLSKTTTATLRTDALSTAAKSFLERAKSFFDYARLDTSYKSNGFALSDHPLTAACLAAHEAAVAAKPKDALAFAKDPAGGAKAAAGAGAAPAAT